VEIHFFAYPRKEFIAQCVANRRKGFDYMTELRFNTKAYGRIKGGITDIDTSIELYPGYIHTLATNWVTAKSLHATIVDRLGNREVITITDIDFKNNKLTASRGVSARSWADGCIISQRITEDDAGQFIQRQNFRQIIYNPNTVLTADYPGEKILQIGTYSCEKRWWKNVSGTEWQLIAGDKCDWESYSGGFIVSPSSDITYSTDQLMQDELTAASIYGVCWSPELGIFCIVGNEIIFTSPDGAIWTKQSPPTHTGSSNTWEKVCWSPSLGLFCAVASSGTQHVMTSPDGVSWTLHNIQSTSFYDVCWSPELGLFCAVGTNYICTSPDGINWTTQTAPSEHWLSVIWSPELNLFCACNISTSVGGIAISANGETWTQYQIDSTNQGGYGIAWSPALGLFCVAGYNTGNYNIAYSNNGSSWARMIYANRLSSICWSPGTGYFVAACGYYSSSKLLVSDDALTWTEVDIIDPYSSGGWRDICWSPDLFKFCLVGNVNNAINTATVLIVPGAI